VTKEAEVVHADTLLVRRALAGQEDAAEALVRRLIPTLRARARRAFKRHPDGFAGRTAADLLNDAWIALSADDGKKLRAWDPARGATLEGFAGMLAESEFNRLRARAMSMKRGGHLRPVEPEALDDVVAGASSPEEGIVTQDLVARLGAHLDEQLPARGQLVFRHAFTDGRTPPEVARLLGVNVQVVYNWQHKIRRIARGFLDAASTT
jgi:RNA polymerase sigma factor (sigma-70 family)